ncbi:MAG: proline dehydrogenase family protein [Anaerolineae bacterium]|nr:proline dehydrogenase family protein [Anaerolineae bacterium]
MLRSFLLFLAKADWARNIITHFPPARLAARRFVAGETVEEAIEAIRRLNAKGMTASLDHLGENVSATTDADRTTETYLGLIERVVATPDLAPTTISVKLTALGLDISEAVCLANMQRILERAQEHNIEVTIDMESSDYTERTLRIYRALHGEQGFKNVGTVIQSYLRRSEADMTELAKLGARIRLCKGAYKEPPTVAFQDKRDVDNNFAILTKIFLRPEAVEAGAYLEIATHDDAVIDAAIYHARKNGLSPDQFEFQMLHGVRTQLQERLVANGYRVRIYVPYGSQWYPYFMRRLAERPANLWFFVSNFFRR